MTYAELLKKYIKESRYTLEEISGLLLQKGLSASREHLSRLQNGKVPPASDEINKAIADITGGDAEELIWCAYIEKAPEEVKNKLSNIKKEQRNSENHLGSTVVDDATTIPKGTKIQYALAEIVLERDSTIKGIREELSSKYPELNSPAASFVYSAPEKILMPVVQAGKKAGPVKTFSEKDEKDIAKRMEEIKKDLSSDGGLSFLGEPMSEEAIESLIEAMEYAVRQTQRINKKYIPKKYRKDDENN